MPEVTGTEPFKERLDIIMDEISMGIQWDRPSLILAVYRSEHIKKVVQSQLTQSFGKINQSVFQYLVDKAHYDIPVDLQDHPDHGRAVYFVSGFRWGGGRGYSNAYRALNMHREYLIDGNVRVIFWLTKKEAKQCSRFAPDFWAFRHKVIEFLELPSKTMTHSPFTSYLITHDLYTRKGTDFLTAITTAERLFELGCIDEAITNFQTSLRIYPDQTAITLQIAKIHLSIGQVDAAKRTLAKLNKEKSKRGKFLLELINLNRAVSSQQSALGGFSRQKP